MTQIIIEFTAKNKPPLHMINQIEEVLAFNHKAELIEDYVVGIVSDIDFPDVDAQILVAVESNKEKEQEADKP